MRRPKNLLSSGMICSILQKIMGRQRKALKEKQIILIPLRVNAADYARAEEGAKKAHLPLAVFARLALFKALEPIP